MQDIISLLACLKLLVQMLKLLKYSYKKLPLIINDVSSNNNNNNNNSSSKNSRDMQQ